MGDNSNGVKKITVSLPDEIEERLREMAEIEFHGLKGGLSIIITNALKDYFDKQDKSDK